MVVSGNAELCGIIDSSLRLDSIGDYSWYLLTNSKVGCIMVPTTHSKIINKVPRRGRQT